MIVRNSTNNHKTLFYLGISLLLLSVVKFLIVYFPSNIIGLIELLWYCNLSLFVLGYILVFCQPNTISKISTIILSTAIPAQFLWIIAFISSYLNIYDFGRISNFTNALVRGAFIDELRYVLSLLEHTLLIPISLYAVYAFGFAKGMIKYIFYITIFILCVSFILSPDNLNVNCTKYLCDIKTSIPIYTYDIKYFLGTLAYWVVVFSGSYYLLSYLFDRFQNK